MAAKKKVAPPKPIPGRPWSELTPAEQNNEYIRALHAYSTKGEANPQTRGAFFKQQSAAEAKG